jgi:hypothetical protein
MEAAGFFKHWFLCMEIYDVKSQRTVLNIAGEYLKVSRYFMHIHSQIMLGKSLSAKRKVLYEVMYFVNLVLRRLFEIRVELLFRVRIISYLNKKTHSHGLNMYVFSTFNKHLLL